MMRFREECNRSLLEELLLGPGGGGHRRRNGLALHLDQTLNGSDALQTWKRTRLWISVDILHQNSE